MSRMSPLIQKRLRNLYALFAKNRVDALLVSSKPNVSYLSGFKSDESWILVSPKNRFFITDSRYLEQAQKEALGFHILLRDKKSVTELVAEIVKRERIRHLGFEAPIVTHSFYLALEKRVGKDRLVATSGLTESLRIVKDLEEQNLIRKSAGIAVKGFHYIKAIARPGMPERDLQGRLEYYTKTLGSEKPAFDIIIATGARSSMPHCQTNQTKTKNNNVLLVDMGVVYEGYHSDLTRPIFLGKMSNLHKQIFNIVWEAQRLGIKMAVAGATCSQVDEACRSVIAKYGYANYFGHSTGHGVGLEIHESPGVASKNPMVLKPGMVITVEPGIYLPGKFGIRIEDMVLIKNKGNEVLTRDLDK